MSANTGNEALPDSSRLTRLRLADNPGTYRMLCRISLIFPIVALMLAGTGCSEIQSPDDTDDMRTNAIEGESNEGFYALSQSWLKAGEFSVDVNNPEFRQFRDGIGERKFRRRVDLIPPFPTGTQVKAIASLAAVDAERIANLRLVLSTESISPQGLDVVMTTWEDTKIWLVKATWLAYAE